MQNTAVETALPVKVFTEYFEEKRLGNLCFPNGACTAVPVESGTDMHFFVRLDSLYKLVSGWRICQTLIELDDIFAVIAFGSAVRFPGFDEVLRKAPKYLFFGERTKKVPIFPRDADFLVITGKDLNREEKLAAIYERDAYNGWDCLKEGGIHLLHRGAKQLVESVRAGDSVGISAMRQGVPIFFDERFNPVVRACGIERTTGRKIFWDEDHKGVLNGWIQ